jgi:acyl-CoA reductase-like NAD-dependent aldehyde dehydrogenase
MTTLDHAPATNATQLFIGGEWRDAETTFTDINPATENPITEIAAGGHEDVDAAVLAARDALDGTWGRLSGRDRGRLLEQIATLIERDADTLARLEAVDIGKPVAQPTLLDVPQAIATFRHFAGWADKIEGRVIPTPGYLGHPTLSYTVHEPVGVIGAIVPWNTPLMIAAWKLAPALAAGNTIVVKPAEDGPLSILHLARLIEEAGVPAGTVNVVTGLGEVAGDALVRHPGVDRISFTGSPEVGISIQATTAKDVKRLTLELGGKSPLIILPDADLEPALDAAPALGSLPTMRCMTTSSLVSLSGHSARYSEIRSIPRPRWDPSSMRSSATASSTTCSTVGMRAHGLSPVADAQSAPVSLLSQRCSPTSTTT